MLSMSTSGLSALAGWSDTRENSPGRSETTQTTMRATASVKDKGANCFLLEISRNYVPQEE